MNTHEEIQVDILFVGAGPASLAGAYHLSNLIQKSSKNISIAIIEKSQNLGDHILSGAVMDPIAIKELIPNYLEEGAPVDALVNQCKTLFLTKNNQFSFPWTPALLGNKGYYLTSLSKLVQWLGKKVQDAGVDVFFETPGSELLYDGDKVIGVRTQSRGLSKNGEKKSTYQPPIDIKAKVTILGEGASGSLTESLIKNLNLREGKQPAVFSTGVKEVWEVPAENHRQGLVLHTLGHPLDKQTFGGGWVYHFKNNQVSIGLVTGLNYSKSDLDLHQEFQEFKRHPMIQKIISGGKPVSYGAKTISEGGYYSMPKLFGSGFLLIGESGGFLNAGRLKGIHCAIKSGMLAAETLLEAIEKEDYSEELLQQFQKRFENSWLKKELWKVRNFHQAFSQGLWRGLFHFMTQLLSGGRGLVDPLPSKEDYVSLKKISEGFEKTSNNKTQDLFLSGVYHEENQPSHIQITNPEVCGSRCLEEYGNPCLSFCPANVFEWLEKESKIQLNPSNCIHCKTCVIKDPYQIIQWKTPEGGGGPRYKEM